VAGATVVVIRFIGTPAPRRQQAHPPVKFGIAGDIVTDLSEHHRYTSDFSKYSHICIEPLA
jgi:hypothetical protein